jgi:hypothetical protein
VLFYWVFLQIEWRTEVQRFPEFPEHFILYRAKKRAQEIEAFIPQDTFLIDQQFNTTTVQYHDRDRMISIFIMLPKVAKARTIVTSVYLCHWHYSANLHQCKHSFNICLHFSKNRAKLVGFKEPKNCILKPTNLVQLLP